MNRIKKLWQILGLIFALCSICSFANPTHSISDSFSLQKEAIVEKRDQIHFYIRPQKNEYAPISSPVSMRDKIPPKSDIEGIYTLPSKYWIGHTFYDGFPSAQQYKDVDGLEWIFTPSKKHLWTQIGMHLEYNVGNGVRDDIVTPVQTTPSFIYSCDISQQNPLIQEVDQKRVVVFSTMNEGIVCLDAISGDKLWSFLLSAGEYVIAGMSSLQYKEDVYIVAATSQKKILLIAAENGKTVRTLSMDAEIVSPLHTFVWEEIAYVAFCTSEKKVIQELFSRKILWEDDNTSLQARSPLSLMANHSFVVVFPFHNGSIVGIHLSTGEKWQKQVDGNILFNITSVSWDGTPYLGITTTKKKLFFLHPSDGRTLLSEDIPGEPKSNVMFLPQYGQYFVVAKRSPQNDTIVFVSGQLGENRAQKKIDIPGQEIFGFCGYRQDSVNKFVFLNDQREFFTISSTDAKLASSFPLSLSTIRSPIQEASLGTCLALTEGMVWAVVPGEGMFRFGNPSPNIANSALSMQTYLSNGFINTSSAFTSGESCYREGDAIPLDNTLSFLPHDVRLYEETRPIPIPGSFWDPYLNQWFLMLTDPKGNLLWFDSKSNLCFTIPLSIGYCYTQPILEIDQKGIWKIFVVSEKEAVYLEFSPQNQTYTILWDATDMKSTGSSLVSFTYQQESFFIFVTDTGYLVALNKHDGRLRYKKKADAFTFCTHYLEHKPVLFCGKDIIHALNGEVLSSFGSSRSDSTTISLDGLLLWLQSFEDDMICKNPQSGELVWKVRKLWCKKFCYRSTSPAVLQKGNIALSYWSDYTRGVCVDIHTGLIRWRLSLVDDYLVEKPIVIATNAASYVVYSTVKGKLYILDALRGNVIHSIQLPKEAPSNSSYTGISTAGYVNGMLLVSRVGYGVYKIGNEKATSTDYPSKHFFVTAPASRKKEFLWNRAELYWENKMCFSNTVRIAVP
ncbi:MAG: PQQ-binding-like beta-propeller repeat protein [Caldisericia bacterium]|nr:PQQ-binding-like beta-propeller repeat protein [Caldisericia bacterium]